MTNQVMCGTVVIMRRLLALVGPSGVGKSTLARGLAAAGLVDLHRTWTTRPRRADEVLSESDHVFVGEERFSAALAAGDLVATVQLFGHRYGLPALPGGASSRAVLLVARAPLLPLLGPLHPDPLVYALTAGSGALRERGTPRALPLEEQQARDEYDRDEQPGAAHRVFDCSGVTAKELLHSVSACLQQDLELEGVRP